MLNPKELNPGQGSSLDDLDLAWQDRLADSKVLIQAGMYAASIASGFYALEIYLKTMICRKLDLTRLPVAFQIHGIDALITLAGLRGRYVQIEKGSTLDINWTELHELSDKLNNLRYSPSNQWTEKQAKRFFEQLESTDGGVLPWLRAQI